MAIAFSDPINPGKSVRKIGKIEILRPLSKFGIGIGLYLLLFSNLENWAQTIQVLGTLVIVLSAIIMAPTKFRRIQLNAFEITLLILIILSTIISGANLADLLQDDRFDLIILNIPVFLSFISLVIITRSLSLQEVYNIASVTFAIMVFTIYMVYWEDIYFSIFQRSNDLDRLKPFDLHPNLAGYIFSGAVVVFAHGALSRKFYRIPYAMVAIAALGICLAASSRGGLLALAIATLLLAPLLFKRLTSIGKKNFLLIFPVLFALVAWHFAPIAQAAVDILELDSNSRGFDSGGTGRTELWAMGWELLFRDPVLLFTGAGIRYSSAEIIGFSTENSYITILLDSGIIAGLGLIVIICIGLWKAVTIHGRGRLISLMPALLIAYCIFEAFFNRYLFSIGNPMSLLFLWSVGFAWHPAPRKVPAA